jgi:hypothetical protein
MTEDNGEAENEHIPKKRKLDDGSEIIEMPIKISA